jgi:hypothetical protein
MLLPPRSPEDYLEIVTSVRSSGIVVTLSCAIGVPASSKRGYPDIFVAFIEVINPGLADFEHWVMDVMIPFWEIEFPSNSLGPYCWIGLNSFKAKSGLSTMEKQPDH